MKKQTLRKLICLAVVCCMAISLGCTAAQPAAPAPATEAAAAPAAGEKAIPDEIKIGITGSMSGDQAISGKNMVDGANLALAELEGGNLLDVDGKKVKITYVIEDCESKPEIAVNAVQKLIKQDGVLAIIGPNNSSDVLSSGEVSQAAQIPQITNAGTNVKVTQIGDYIFRAGFIDPFQGTVAAEFAYKTLGLRNAAVLYNNGDNFSSGLDAAFVEAWEKLGGTMVAHEAFSGYDSKDYTAQLTVIKNANPDFLYLPSDVNTVPLEMQQARAMGIECPFLGCDAWDYSVLDELAGLDVIEGAYYVTGFSADDANAKDFVDAFVKAYDYRPGFGAAMAYECARVIFNAIQNAETIDGTGIRDAMMKTDMQLPSGHFVFDENRNPTKGAVVLQKHNGTGVFVAALNPNEG